MTYIILKIIKIRKNNQKINIYLKDLGRKVHCNGAKLNCEKVDMILENQYIKDKEVAEALNVMPNTLAKWRMKNSNGPKLPYVKIGRSIMYRREAIERRLLENERINTSTT